jgi:large subunit ribosomal protein L4
VSGRGAKVRAQKGGGIARAGNKRPPHWRGGVKAHGPKGSVQNYEKKLKKKVGMMGVRMALSQKLKERNLILVHSYEGLGSYKTKVLAKALNEAGYIGGRYGFTACLIDHV